MADDSQYDGVSPPCSLLVPSPLRTPSHHCDRPVPDDGERWHTRMMSSNVFSLQLSKSSPFQCLRPCLWRSTGTNFARGTTTLGGTGRICTGKKRTSSSAKTVSQSTAASTASQPSLSSPSHSSSPSVPKVTPNLRTYSQKSLLGRCPTSQDNSPTIEGLQESPHHERPLSVHINLSMPPIEARASACTPESTYECVIVTVDASFGKKKNMFLGFASPDGTVGGGSKQLSAEAPSTRKK